MLQAALSDFNAFIAEALPEPGLLPGLPRTTVVRVLLKVPEAFRCLLESLQAGRTLLCPSSRTEMSAVVGVASWLVCW